VYVQTLLAFLNSAFFALPVVTSDRQPNYPASLPDFPLLSAKPEQGLGLGSTKVGLTALVWQNIPQSYVSV